MGFGINCVSNANRKLEIVRGAAEHYYSFLPALQEQFIPNITIIYTISVLKAVVLNII